jgi:hypothetical protein
MKDLKRILQKNQSGAHPEKILFWMGAGHQPICQTRYFNGFSPKTLHAQPLD